MKDLIRKILREGMQIKDDAPDWVKKFNKLPREERIKDFEKRKVEMKKIIPIIVKYFKEKFGEELVDIKVGEKRVYLGNEDYSTGKILLEFKISDLVDNPHKVVREINRDLNNFFNIDQTYYGSPLETEFHQLT